MKEILDISVTLANKVRQEQLEQPEQLVLKSYHFRQLRDELHEKLEEDAQVSLHPVLE